MARSDNRKRPNHSDEKIAAWVRRMREGTTIGTIAQEEGITRTAVYSAMHRRNITCTYTTKSWKRSEVLELHRRVTKEGKRADDVAISAGLSTNGLYKLFAKWGVALGKRSRPRSDYDTNRKIYRMRVEGATYAAIAEALSWEQPKEKGWRRVYMRLVRFCERAEIPFPSVRVKRARRKREPIMTKTLPSHTTLQHTSSP